MDSLDSSKLKSGMINQVLNQSVSHPATASGSWSEVERLTMLKLLPS